MDYEGNSPAYQVLLTVNPNVEPGSINPLPLMATIIGILILRPLKRKGVINHWSTLYPQAFLAANGPPDLPDRLPGAAVRSRV